MVGLLLILKHGAIYSVLLQAHSQCVVLSLAVAKDLFFLTMYSVTEVKATCFCVVTTLLESITVSTLRMLE